MADQVRLSGFLPGEERNGLKAHEDDFLDIDAPDPVVVVALIERKKRTVDDDTDEVSASIRITQLEVLDGADADAGREFLHTYRTRRTGDAQLDGVEV